MRLLPLGLVAAQSEYYFQHWCGAYYLPMLDDANCAKTFPSDLTRGECPVPVLTSVPSGYVADTALDRIQVDTSRLSHVTGADVCIVMTKRVNINGKVRPYNKYFCNSSAAANTAYETWSSSKVFAAANAGSNMRKGSPTCSSGRFGLDAKVWGKNGYTQLADLVTAVVAYDETAGYSSNGLSAYFHDIGGRDSMNSLVKSPWLGQSQNSLGGNYGESVPYDLGLTFIDEYGEACVVSRDNPSQVYPNSLTLLAQSELLRRLVQHNIVDEGVQWPNLEARDLEQILYGADETGLFGSQQWGGMTADTAIYLQNSLNMPEVERLSGGSWRIYSKLGAGYSSSRRVGEIITLAYGCFPDLLNDRENFEFTVAVRGSVANDSFLFNAEQRVKDAMDRTIQAVWEGRLN
ncbi:Oidioi.mRNA.OKI2018_I69.XSR.g13698.t1.cds [Oikopleura dioica]|uniref:Oidioi.mRNA.OKI2018_I69.XSR.g13698.t1.cds n=1 Tax=Oikopleura dioica TaxID=34765 RepID=A0ABN7SDT0_OIKDI|nr:Oidioi.mRNA.OKI2018_I69.XSR.g13698.t1.cds [Oikopleura dioica]